jgi:hypothetical protein
MHRAVSSWSLTTPRRRRSPPQRTARGRPSQHPPRSSPHGDPDRRHIGNPRRTLRKLARTGGLWRDSLSAAYPEQGHLVDAITVPGNVMELAARVEERSTEQVLAEAVVASAGHLRRPAAPVPSRSRDSDTPSCLVEPPETPDRRLAMLLAPGNAGMRRRR